MCVVAYTKLSLRAARKSLSKVELARVGSRPAWGLLVWGRALCVAYPVSVMRPGLKERTLTPPGWGWG